MADVEAILAHLDAEAAAASGGGGAVDLLLERDPRPARWPFGDCVEVLPGLWGVVHRPLLWSDGVVPACRVRLWRPDVRAWFAGARHRACAACGRVVEAVGDRLTPHSDDVAGAPWCSGSGRSVADHAALLSYPRPAHMVPDGRCPGCGGEPEVVRLATLDPLRLSFAVRCHGAQVRVDIADATGALGRGRPYDHDFERHAMAALRLAIQQLPPPPSGGMVEVRFEVPR
jgi:hypothetical protein